MINIIFYILIILIFFLLSYLINTLLKKHNNLTILITLLCTLIIILIILNPKLCITATLDGLKLFIYNVFPSVFVFMAIFNIILASGGIKIYSDIFGYILCRPFNLPKQCSIVLIISLICGYPLGTKYAIHLYENGTIDRTTTERLLIIASNSSPLFVIGSVGTIMLGNKNLGYLLLIISNLSVIIVGFLTKNKVSSEHNKSTKKITKNYSQKNLGEIIKKSLENALFSSMNIGGFIIFFSLIISLLNNYIFIFIPNKIIKSTINGLIEVTYGCKNISLLTLDINLKFLLTLFIVSFSGMSIISQIYSLIYRYEFSIKKYISYKILHAFVSILIGFILIKVNPFDNSVFNSMHNNSQNTLQLLLIVIFFIFLLPLGIFKK